ncbi:hypothetical protein P691DRAFT_798103 [Macrolepiota fuliginosa MF-IS2]|uniref:Uncharacterized protein n=1 Tax=Macrolepiota fuliginosa MF-IS2 TaxID=1400762 RepID=A0A9P5XJ38_9AGAR|nr:hypothetical protein P691DRAFT_798103 [Macrolepiota fuliginosa MF-IS2]
MVRFKIYNALKQSILSNFGDTGWGAVGLSLTVKYFSPATNVAIIRVGRDQHRVAWGGVTLLKEIDGWKIIPYVVHVSGARNSVFIRGRCSRRHQIGTIKHAQLAAIAHNREVVARFRARSKLPPTYQDSYTQFLENSEREIGALQD